MRGEVEGGEEEEKKKGGGYGGGHCPLIGSGQSISEGA